MLRCDTPVFSSVSSLVEMFCVIRATAPIRDPRTRRIVAPVASLDALFTSAPRTEIDAEEIWNCTTIWD